MNLADIEQRPEIAAINKRIRLKQEALARLKSDMSEDARQKQAALNVAREEAEIEAARQERKQALQRARAEAVTELVPQFDKLVREARDLTAKVSELHAKIKAKHDEIGQAAGGRNPKPTLHITALLPESARNRTEFARWLAETDHYLASPPKPEPKPRRKRLSDVLKPTRKKAAKKKTTKK